MEYFWESSFLFTNNSQITSAEKKSYSAITTLQSNETRQTLEEYDKIYMVESCLENFKDLELKWDHSNGNIQMKDKLYSDILY